MSFAFEIPEVMYGQVTGIAKGEEQTGDYGEYSFISFEVTDFSGGIKPYGPSLKTPPGWPNSINGRSQAAEWLKRAVAISPEWANFVRKPNKGEQKETAATVEAAFRWLVGKWVKWEKMAFSYKIKGEESTSMRWVPVELYANRDACAAAEVADNDGNVTAAAEEVAAVSPREEQARTVWTSLAPMGETRPVFFLQAMGGDTPENRALMELVQG